ncbi:calcium-binding protein [uncultured Jannaschia sp.]|uniref:calcium-binding protein n=1 Tax=uncultured Jannaschia sp. TaxID=293347 RepID=UPI00262B8BB7|nr:calcium-binding protein [uncultured Jannaschia sp.]
MTSIDHIETYTRGDISLIRNITDMDVHSVGGVGRLYVVTTMGGGRSTWDLDGGMAVRSARLDSGYGLSHTVQLEAITIDGHDVMVAFSRAMPGLDGHVLDQIGRLSQTDGATGTGGDAFTAMAFVSTTGGATLLTADASGTLQGWQMDAAGAMTRTATFQTEGIDIPAMAHVGVGGTTVILAISRDGNTVSSFTVDAAGGLAAGDVAGIGAGELPVNALSAVATATVGGAAFVVIGAAGSNSLSVMEVGADGRLAVTDHVLDGRETRFEGVAAIETVEADGRAFLIAGGTDDGVSLLELLPDGRLLHLAQVADQLDTTLQNVGTIAASVQNGAIEIFVSSTTEAGITRFSVDLATLPRVLQDGDGAGTLAGGAGPDVFVLVADDQPDTVTGFNIATDRLDLSAWTNLRGTDQLDLQRNSVGATITYGDEVLVIRSHDGTGLEVEDLRAAIDLPLSHYVTAVRDLSGTTGNDSILGTAESDAISGGEGFDTLVGADGSDALAGGAGQDELWGGNGDDSLSGGSWADVLYGDAGNDTLRGDDGDDLMFGGAGDDLLDGGVNTDTISGGDGADRIFGGDWSDSLAGDAGDDTLDGGQGNDTMEGGLGHDVITGGEGYDRIYGGDGDDTIDGGVGADQIWGGAGQDRIAGGSWSDILHGDAGDDYLIGGDGTDQLFGGVGNDTLMGGEGQDVMHGDDGDDLLFGDTWSDMLYGGAGRDTLDGATGDDKLEGGDGDDLLLGGDGFDRLLGGTGNDTIEGGEQRDWLKGGDGDDDLDGGGWNDMMFGDDGNDVMRGGHGDDGLSGGMGNDSIWGDDGRDQLYGGGGNDLLHGGTWADELYGGFGDDTLSGDAGGDLLLGGGGADTFRYDAGHDRIVDFDPAVDRLLFDAALWNGQRPDQAAFDAKAEVVGSDLVLSFHDFDSLTLEGITSTAGLSYDVAAF